MRLVHVSDWHVGLTTGQHPRRPDHDRVLGEIEAITREFNPDLVLHTGDLFHHVSPAVDDLRYALEALQRLAALAPTVVLRGNHDSDRLFRVFAILLAGNQRLRFIDAPPRLQDPSPILRIPSKDAHHAFAIAALPFVHANRFIERYTDAETQSVTFAEGLGKYERTLGEKLNADLDKKREVAIFAAHQYVQGTTRSGSERPIHVGEEYATRSVDIPAVSYAAFGHIHKPQQIGARGLARYAGSPIPIDFGEEGEVKSVVCVEAEPARAARVELVGLSGGRPLLTVHTTLPLLPTLAERCAGTLCKVKVTTEVPTSDLARRVQEALPGAAIVEVVDDCVTSRATAVEESGDTGDAPSLPELFAEFLSNHPTVGAESARVKAAFGALLDASELGEDPSLRDLGLDERDLAAEPAP